MPPTGAVLLGLAGNEPATIDPAAIDLTVKEIRVAQRIELAGTRPIHFDEIGDMLLHRETMFPPGAQTPASPMDSASQPSMRRA